MQASEPESIGRGIMSRCEVDDLARIAAGDQEALRGLYMAYRLRLWRYLWTQLDGRPEWVEDVLQDVFVELWRSAGNYRAEASVSTWLFRIARNVASNARRAHSRRGGDHRVALPSAGHEETKLSKLLQQDSCEDAVLDRLVLGDALRQLSVKHREVIDLISYHGFSCEEVANILSIPLGTVKSRLSYARQALAAALNVGASERRVV